MRSFDVHILHVSMEGSAGHMITEHLLNANIDMSRGFTQTALLLSRDER